MDIATLLGINKSSSTEEKQPVLDTVQEMTTKTSENPLEPEEDPAPEGAGGP